MIHVAMPAGAKAKRLPFYLAMEEWVAQRLPARKYFFTWVVPPTVICGRNQDVHAEVNLSYCQQHGIQVYRRKSGGGCVYADADNLMLSYITPDTQVETTFREYTAMVAAALRQLGLSASATGRNDIAVGDRKISGNAFYHMPGRSIVHGTLLYSTCMQHMLNAITPSRSKLTSKQVQSVAARIATVAELLPALTLEQLRAHLISSLTSEQYVLTEADMSEIHEIELPYYEAGWLMGRRGQAGEELHSYEAHLPDCGNFTVNMALKHGRIQDVNLTGDFFLLSELDAGMLDALRHAELNRAALDRALQGIDASKVIAGLTTPRLIDLLLMPATA